MTTTEDTVLGGRVRLRQAADGYRAGVDAALLAAACDAAPGARVMEAGCGAGGALLAAAARRLDARFVGVEREAEAADLARINIAANGMRSRVDVILGDIALPFSRLAVAPFDMVMANPPFFDDPGALRGPSEAKKPAWMATEGLAAWTGFLTKAARQGGVILMIHRADRLADILAALAPKAGSFQVRPVHPFADAPAKRVLVRAVKTGRAPLKLLPPLILHDRGGAKHTAEVEAILRGETGLAWG